MDVNPLAIVELLLGALAVIIGIRGTQGKVFSSLTGHGTTATTDPSVATTGSTGSPYAGILGQYAAGKSFVQP